MHPQIEKLVIDLAEQGIPPEITIAAAIEAFEEGVPLGQIPKVVTSLVNQALGKHKKFPPRSEREERAEAARREANEEEAKLRRRSKETELEKRSKRLANPHGDELLRSLERSGDSLRLELEKHRRGMPSQICQMCGGRMYVGIIRGIKVCECCAAVEEDAWTGDQYSGYAPHGDSRFMTNFIGYPLMCCTRHTTSASGWPTMTGRRSVLHHYRFVDAQGRSWYGKGAGPGMFLQIHRGKARHANKTNPAAVATREAQAAWRLVKGC